MTDERRAILDAEVCLPASRSGVHKETTVTDLSFGQFLKEMSLAQLDEFIDRLERLIPLTTGAKQQGFRTQLRCAKEEKASRKAT